MKLHKTRPGIRRINEGFKLVGRGLITKRGGLAMKVLKWGVGWD